MTKSNTPDTLEALRSISAPATIHVAGDIRAHSWSSAARLLDIWEEKRGDAKAPPRFALKPLEISEVMPFLSIFDVSYSPLTLTCRLMGSAFADAIGYDATGNTADDYDRTEMLVRRAAWICANVQPMLLLGLPLVWSPEKNYKTYDTLSLPFVDDTGVVDTILYFNRFHGNEEKNSTHDILLS